MNAKAHINSYWIKIILKTRIKRTSGIITVILLLHVMLRVVYLRKAVIYQIFHVIALCFKDKSLEILPFGKVDSKNVEEYYDGSVKVDGKDVDVDLNFESESVDHDLVKNVGSVISNILEFAHQAWSAISDDWELGAESETARFYLQHHLDELSEEEVVKLFGTSSVDKSVFFKALSLVRIGLYPEDDEMFTVFDIQLSQELTDYLMSVSIGSDGQVTGISFES